MEWRFLNMTARKQLRADDAGFPLPFIGTQMPGTPDEKRLGACVTPSSTPKCRRTKM